MGSFKEAFGRGFGVGAATYYHFRGTDKEMYFMKQCIDIRKCADGTKGSAWKKCKCGNNLCIDVGDCIREGEFRWYASGHCNKCGDAMEMDGQGIFDLPYDIKQEIVNREGEWVLYTKCSKTTISFALKKIFKEPIHDIFMEKNIIFIGTK